MLALVEPGDEVVLFEPYYDSYAASVALAGATRRVVSLVETGTGRFARRPRRAAGRDRPRGPALILVNSPHNPTGHGVHPRRAGRHRGASASSTT